jgi:hypothetical protein
MRRNRLHALLWTLALTTGAAVAAAQDPTPKNPAPKKAPAEAPRRAPAKQAPPVEEAPAAPAEGAPSEPAPSDEAPEAPASEPAAQEPAPSGAAAAEPAEASAPAVAEALPEVAEAPTRCSADDVAALLEARRDALVRVEAPGARGLGFVFHSRRHVLTALSIVDVGRGIKVLFGDEQRDAKVVAMDRAHDLALLELDEDGPAAPLRLAPASPAVGDPVVALRVSEDWGHPRARENRRYFKSRGWRAYRNFRGDVIAEPGTVSFAGAGRFRTDALGGHHKSWGAPVLDCAARVVGIATSPFADEVVTVKSMRALADGAGDEAVYDGRWSLFNPSIGLVGQLDHQASPGFDTPDKWLGISVGTALMGDDRWFFPARFTATFLLGPELGEPFASREGYRVAGSLGLGYRIMLKGGGIPVYLVPVVGGMVQYESITTERTEFWVDDGCTGACRANPYVFRLEEEQLRWMPTFGGGLQIGPVEAAYQFVLDTDHTEYSVHQLTLGAQF